MINEMKSMLVFAVLVVTLPLIFCHDSDATCSAKQIEDYIECKKAKWATFDDDTPNKVITKSKDFFRDCLKKCDPGMDRSSCVRTCFKKINDGNACSRELSGCVSSKLCHCIDRALVVINESNNEDKPMNKKQKLDILQQNQDDVDTMLAKCEDENQPHQPQSVETRKILSRMLKKVCE